MLLGVGRGGPGLIPAPGSLQNLGRSCRRNGRTAKVWLCVSFHAAVPMILHPVQPIRVGVVDNSFIQIFNLIPVNSGGADGRGGGAGIRII